MKKRIVATMLAATTLLSLVGMTACGGGGGYKYPDKPNTVLAEGENSWDKWKDECPEGLTIDWYSDAFLSVNEKSKITKAIKAKTGITVNFDTALSSGTDKLSLMIGGDTLPDVITLDGQDERFWQLGNQGYLFPINGLQERWAPSLDIPLDVQNVYTMKDGNLYGLPSYFRTSEDSDTKLETNGGMMIREDWYQAYMAHVTDNVFGGKTTREAVGAELWDQWDITTPDGLIHAMKWVRDNVLTAAQKKTYNAFVLDPFFPGSVSQGVAWLCQYFAVRFEDDEGNYIDGARTEQYKQVLKFLNQLYREGLLTENALNAADYGDVGQMIANGQIFVYCGSPQVYPGYWNSAKFPQEEGVDPVTYESFVMTNYDRETPQLGDIAGMGYSLTCITKNCKRPDIVIKLLDYLYSDEGNRLAWYGIEGVADASGNITAVKDPDLAEIFTVSDVTYYCTADGQVHYTEKYLADKGAVNEDYFAVGAQEWTMLNRPNYLDSINLTTEMTAKDAYIANMKMPLTPYSTSYFVTSNLFDVLSPDYTEIVKTNSKLGSLWASATMQFIKAKSYDEVLTISNNACKQADNNGHVMVYEKYNEGYQAKKKANNIQYGWALNDPNWKPVEIKERETFEYKGKTYTDIFGARGDVSYYRDYTILD